MRQLTRVAAAAAAAPSTPNMLTIPNSITAADAIVNIAGSGTTRQIPASEFFVDWLETALEPGEVVISVIIPPDPSGASVHYEKFTRADGDFATVSVAVCLRILDDVVETARIAVGGIAEKPVRSPSDEKALIGHPLTEDAIQDFSASLEPLCNPIDDMRGSADYRLMLMPRLIHRALNQALKTQLTSDLEGTA